MGRRSLALAMLLTLLFSGCRDDNAAMQAALDFRRELLDAGGCSFSADVEADYGDRVYDFSLDCAYDGTDGTVTVTAPQSIAGISAVTRGASAELEFDGVCMDFGELAGGFVPPLSVPWLLGSAWTGDHIAWAGMDGEMALVTCLKGYEEEEITLQTWFQKNIPVRTEILRGGHRVLTVTIGDFSLTQ